MKKEEFFERLEYLLQDIPDEEKAEAVQYYRDYLEEAGPEREEEVLEEFGSPERTAAIIRADRMGNLEDGGAFTETGYEDERFRDPNYQVARRYDLPEEREQKKQSHSYVHEDSGCRENREHSEYNQVKKERWTCRPLKWALWAVLLIIASPFLLGFGITLLSAAAVILFFIAGILLAAAGITAAAFICGAVMSASGIVFLAASPMEGLLLLGFGIIGFGCGFLGLAIISAFVGLLLPFLWKGLGLLWKVITGRGKGKKKNA